MKTVHAFITDECFKTFTDKFLPKVRDITLNV